MFALPYRRVVEAVHTAQSPIVETIQPPRETAGPIKFALASKIDTPDTDLRLWQKTYKM